MKKRGLGLISLLMAMVLVLNFSITAVADPVTDENYDSATAAFYVYVNGINADGTAAGALNPTVSDIITEQGVYYDYALLPQVLAEGQTGALSATDTALSRVPNHYKITGWTLWNRGSGDVHSETEQVDLGVDTIANKDLFMSYGAAMDSEDENGNPIVLMYAPVIEAVLAPINYTIDFTDITGRALVNNRLTFSVENQPSASFPTNSDIGVDTGTDIEWHIYYGSTDGGKVANVTAAYDNFLNTRTKENGIVSATIMPVIVKKDSDAKVSIDSWTYGEAAKTPTLTGSLISNAVYMYKADGAADSTYSTTVPTAAGNYVVKAAIPGNAYYNEGNPTAKFSISYLSVPANPYTISGNKNGAGWYNRNVTIEPAAGYSISTDQTNWSESISITSSQTPVIYLQNANKGITDKITVEAIKIDKTEPLITGATDGYTYYDKETVTATISDDNLSSVTLNGKAVAFSGSTATVNMPVSDADYTIVAADIAGNETTCTISVKAASADNTTIEGNCSMKLTSGVEYMLSEGEWKVTGDNTVYAGGNSFYVSADGEYEFTKQ